MEKRIQSPLGKHLLIEFYECDPEVLNNESLVSGLLCDAVDRAKGTIIGKLFHQFSPQGVTGVVVISESHLAIHTWPEHGYAAVDFFSCNLEMNFEVAALHLREGFRSKRMKERHLARGDELKVRECPNLSPSVY